MPPCLDGMSTGPDALSGGRDALPAGADPLPARRDALPARGDAVSAGADRVSSGRHALPGAGNAVPAQVDAVSGEPNIPACPDCGAGGQVHHETHHGFEVPCPRCRTQLVVKLKRGSRSEDNDLSNGS